MLCKSLRPTVQVRHWAATPPPHEVRAGDIVVVDLTNPQPHVDVRSLDLLLQRATLCLLPGDSPISPQWLTSLRSLAYTSSGDRRATKE